MTNNYNQEENASPHEIQTEQSVLGALLLDNSLLEKSPSVDPSIFYDAVHARIFNLIVMRVQAGKLASPVTLKSDMSKDKGLSELGGPPYLVRLSGAATSRDFVQNVQSLVDLHQRRQIIEAAETLTSRASKTEDLNLSDILTEAMISLQDALSASSSVPLVQSNLSVMTDAINTVNQIKNGEEEAGVSTGIKALDDVIGPLKKGRLYVMAARPSMGKTALAISIAQNMVNAGRPVVFATLEMMAEELAYRRQSMLLAAKGITIPYRNIENAWLSDEEFRQVVLLARETEAQEFLTIPNDHKHISKLSAAISTAVRETGRHPLVVVDYLGLIKTDNKNRFDSVSEASNEMKGLAQKLKVPILLLSQLSRQLESRDDKRPRLDDLRMSGDIEQDADVVMFVYREAYYHERSKPARKSDWAEWSVDLESMKNECDVIVAKQRSGALKTVQLKVDLSTNTFTDPPEAQTDMGFEK